MKYVIESLAVIGCCTVIALLGFLTFFFMAATPSKKSVYPESNQRDQSNHAR